MYTNNTTQHHYRHRIHSVLQHLYNPLNSINTMNDKNGHGPDPQQLVNNPTLFSNITSTVIVLAGVSGTGKTTIGIKLAQQLNYHYIEGDDYHTEQNKKKMSNGQPLNDNDRMPWLHKLHDIIADAIQHNKRIIVACSALKRSYRQILVQDITTKHDDEIQFILLAADKDILLDRINKRKGHYMKADMLQSQLDTLEPPGKNEKIILIDVTPPVDTIVEQIKHKLIDSYTH